jgi:CRP-like cAMP-binding protein
VGGRGPYDHIVRLGRLTAYERVAHLVLDIRDRLALVGLAAPDSFPPPLTQETLADVLGLSSVHVNRMLQQLRRDGLVGAGVRPRPPADAEVAGAGLRLCPA